MANWVRIVDVLKDPKKYGDFHNKYISYTFSGGVLSFSADVTGWPLEQVIEAEKDLEWHPFMDGPSPCLISSSTKATIGLEGKTSFDKGPRILKDIAHLYTSEQPYVLSVSPLSVTIFRELPDSLRNCSSWLANSVQCTDYTIGYGMYFTDGGKEQNTCFELSKNCNHEMRQVVYLHPRTMVEIGNPDRDGSSPEKALRLSIILDDEPLLPKDAASSDKKSELKNLTLSSDDLLRIRTCAQTILDCAEEFIKFLDNYS